jgi:hypothetical protein
LSVNGFFRGGVCAELSYRDCENGGMLMHYGSIVYLLKLYQRDSQDLTEEVVDQAILACWNAVSKEKGSNS